MNWKGRAKVIGGKLVMVEAVPLPDETDVIVQVEPAPSPRPFPASEEEEDFAAFFGMWADREEMQDSVNWVQQERDKWRQRLNHPD